MATTTVTYQPSELADIQPLQHHEAGQWHGRPPSDVELPALPPIDRGRKAYEFLAACFILEALVWGFPFSYGIFQLHYRTHPLFASNPTGIAAIGTTQTGVMYFSSPFVALFMQRWPQARRPAMILAAVCMVLSLVGASFCNTVGGLLACQGVLYGVSGLMLYFPAMYYIDEWFSARRGLAYGIMWAGTGSAGVIVPFLSQWFLNTYGFRTTLRTYAIILALGLTPCLFWVRGRLPITRGNALRPNDLKCLRQAPFWLFEAGVVAQSLGFFFPLIWIPSFAQAIGLPTYAGTLGLALANLSNIFGTIFLGGLVDRFHVSVAISISTIGQVVAIFIFWGLTTSQGMLYTFALVWSLFGGGFPATWSGYANAMKRSGTTYGGDPIGSAGMDTGLVVALMAAGKGVGAITSGPLSESLLSAGVDFHARFAYGTSYGVLIVFSGVSALLGGMACLGRLFKVI